MKIGVWGDSIVYGGGDETGLGWVGHLRKYFYEKEVNVYNRGICGYTSEDLLSRFEAELHSIDPDVVIFAIGINDAVILPVVGSAVVPLPTFKKNIQSLLSVAKQKTEKVLVFGLTDVDFEKEEIAQWFRDEDMRKFDSCLEEVAKEMNVAYLSMQNVLDVRTDLVDGIHPNAEGYKKMFNTIFPSVESLVSNR